MPRVTSVPQVLDAVRGRWDEQVARPQVRPAWDVVATLRPAWWVVRAWIAAIAVAVVVPGWYDYGYVWLPGVPQELAIVIIGVCVAVSTLVGMGRVWPGARPDGSRGSAARIVLLALNLGAIVLVPFASDRLQRTQWTGYEQGYRDAYVGATSPDQGVLNRGEQVCNIAAYDAEGQPLVGVQLFDQAGRPLDVRCWRQQDRTVPWVLGDVTRWNVFPLGERDRPARTQEQREDLLGAAFPTPDRATTPAVTNPLVPADAEVRPTPAREKDRDRREREREGGDVSRR
jgi:hypothetical protein